MVGVEGLGLEDSGKAVTLGVDSGVTATGVGVTGVSSKEALGVGWTWGFADLATTGCCRGLGALRFLAHGVGGFGNVGLFFLEGIFSSPE